MNVQEVAEWMKPIIQYLEHGTLPEDKLQARKLRVKAAYYFMHNGELYRRSLSHPWSKCVSHEEGNYVLREIHEGICGAHEAQNTIVWKKPYYKVTIGPTCQRTLLNSSRNASSASNLLDSLTSPPMFSIQLEVHDPFLYGEWTSWTSPSFHIQKEVF